MDFKELKNKKVGDLHSTLNESRDKLRDLRFKDANKQLKNVREIRKIKTTIAQILTLLNLGKKDEVNIKADENVVEQENK